METLQVVLDEAQIQEKVKEMASAISATCGQKPIHIVGLLDNAFIFTADLVRQMTCPVVCHFTKFEMRDIVIDGAHEQRQIDYHLPLDVAGQDVVIVDCILQTGITLDHLVRHLMVKGTRSVRTAVLIDKVDERRLDAPADFVGFRIEGEHFLVGYGLAYRQLYRNLPYVASMSKAAQGVKV